ncbi:hypothetical protein A5844_002119 [Enterococcus sp. 10A9_DIV0425]|uniref:Lipoprotein n=1 Tax=Candidatus Enterococcus wittei TaxID=1987383 RepID=A0A242JZ70_9ENTE|nr:alpha/beta fold hydrolase [Enterococcus sp. 10A9_DIV0425]OTP10419.1 hypothetical protein A5844_002119 [Enterococcus sp. 10A9_DIV0425]THE14566.1 alpha/beta fold hydrolase [Enterococcus hirae]
MILGNKWKLKKGFSILLLIGLIFLVGCQTGKDTVQKKSTTSETTMTSLSKEEAIEKTVTPTLFIHGYKGTVNSFKGMLQRLEEQDNGKKELTLYVDANGNVRAEGELSKQATNPMVQVIFEDNENNEWNQTDWIRACLLYLQITYQVDQVNIVGHSMGGVSGLRYLVTYGQDTSLPKVDKFVALGAPFNDFVDDSGQSVTDELTNGPAVVSSRYQDYQTLVGNLPTTTQVLLIAGQISETDVSDGTVPVNSALAVYALIKQHGNEITEQIIQGTNASHSMLHENKEVDQAVNQFLWKTDG